MKTKWKNGFTLIELLVVIAILGILAMAVIIAINPARNINQAKDSNVRSDTSQIAHAILVYSTNNLGIYPPTLKTLVDDGDINPIPKQPDNTDYVYRRSSVCSSLECSSVLWGKLYNAPENHVWCWDSAHNSFKESVNAPVDPSTTCP